MTIDEADYEPRPADDCVARILTNYKPIGICSLHDWRRYRSIEAGSCPSIKTARCHQLGCNFDELPHG